MADEIQKDPLDTASNAVSGEHSAKQNVLAADASKLQPSTPVALNTATTAAPNLLQDAPEPKILEEVVIPHEKKVVSPPVPTVPPAVPKVVPPPTPAPAPQPKPRPPVTSAVPPVSMTLPVSAAKPEPKTIRADITKILDEVKLPERRAPAQTGDQNGAADAKVVSPISPQAPSLKESIADPTQISKDVPAQSAKREAGSVAAVHTLKDDLQGVVRDKKISVVRAVSLEEDRRVRKAAEKVEAPATTQRSKRTFGVIFSIVLLMLLGAGALFGVYTVMQQRTGTPPPPINASSILFAEQSVPLSLDDTAQGDLKRMLASARVAQNGSLGSITRIIPVKTVGTDGGSEQVPATFAEFMQALGVHAPEDLIRALGNDFFFGIHTVDKNAPLFVIPVTSHDHAFAGMLEWESSLNADLAPVFTSVPVLATDGNGLPIKRVFQDLVMRNYDVRALKDDSGTTQLYYSFPTQNILIIAESPYSFTEILSRLQASRKL
ncbi:MAG: hypothetical protein Q7S50_02980 [bacterium]|nr:hypothetical protein [bacterium]